VTLRKDSARFVEEYLVWSGRSRATIDGYRKDLRYFADYIEKKKNCQAFTDEITEADLEGYLHYLKVEKGCSQRTISRYLGSLKSFFKYAVRQKVITHNPAEGIITPKVPKRLPVFLSKDEVSRLASAARSRTIKTIIWTLYLTGLRNSELCSLRLDDVDFGRNIITVRQGKGGKDRIVPLNPRLVVRLKDYLENHRVHRGTEIFFSTRSGGITPAYVSQCIREAARRAGFKQSISAHTLRHSFATALYQKGVGLLEISALLGHGSVNTTQIYAHLGNNQLQRAVQLL